MKTSAEPRRGTLLSGCTRKSHSASFTTTCSRVTGFGPPFWTCTTNSCSVGRVTRPTVRSSTGGASLRPTPTPFDNIDASNTPRPKSGRRPRSTQAGPRFSRPIPLLLYLEQTHPAKLRELADMGMKHELAGETVAELQDPALPLAEDLRVCELGGFDLPARGVPRARRVILEEVGVRVEAVYEVELEHVDRVHPDQTPLLYLYGMALVVEGDSVDGVEFVGGVEVGVEAVHDHDHLIGLGTAFFGVYDEGPVESFFDVLPERRRVAVVEMQPGRLGVELVHELLPRPYELEDPIHVGRVEAVKVDGVGMRAVVLEADAQPFPLRGPQGGAGNLPVVGPGRIHDARSDFYLGLLRGQLELPDGPPAFPALLPLVEIPQERRGIEPREIYIPDNSVTAVEIVPGPRGGNVPTLMMRFLPEGPLDMRPKHSARGTKCPYGPRYPKEIPPRECGDLGTLSQCNLPLADRNQGTLHVK